VKSNGRSHDAVTAANLWTISEELTGVRYSIDNKELAGG